MTDESLGLSSRGESVAIFSFALFYVTLLSFRRKHVVLINAVGNLNMDKWCKWMLRSQRAGPHQMLSTGTQHLFLSAPHHHHPLPMGNMIQLTGTRNSGTTFPRLLSQLGYEYSQFLPCEVRKTEGGQKPFTRALATGSFCSSQYISDQTARQLCLSLQVAATAFQTS